MQLNKELKGSKTSSSTPESDTTLLRSVTRESQLSPSSTATVITVLSGARTQLAAVSAAS